MLGEHRRQNWRRQYALAYWSRWPARLSVEPCSPNPPKSRSTTCCSSRRRLRAPGRDLPDQGFFPEECACLAASRCGQTRTDPQRREENGPDFAVIWARNYGKGRVRYNGLGHVQAVWDRPEFQKMWLEMIQWSMGLVPGDATPRPKPDK